MTYDYDLDNCLKVYSGITDKAHVRQLMLLHYLLHDQKILATEGTYNGIASFNAIYQELEEDIIDGTAIHFLVTHVEPAAYAILATKLREAFYKVPQQDGKNYADLNMLSAGLAQPRTFLKIYKVRGHYIVLGTPNLNRDMVITAIIMLESSNDREFAMRCQTAVYGGYPFPFIKGEVALIAQFMQGYHAVKHLAAYRNTLEKTLLKPKDFKGDIDIRKEMIKDLTTRLDLVCRELEDLNMRQYYMDYNIGDANNPMTEALNHIMNNRINNVLDIHTDGSYLYMTVTGTMTCSQSMEEFLRGSRNGRHKLHDKPGLVQLFRDIGEGNVRIKMYGTFRIDYRFKDRDPIIGYETRLDDALLAPYIINTHVYPVNCMREAISQLLKYAHKGDYVGFFEHMFYTVGSVHPMDGGTMPEIVDDFIYKCKDGFKIGYRTPDGWKDITMEEYYALLQTTEGQDGQADKQDA